MEKVVAWETGPGWQLEVRTDPSGHAHVLQIAIVDGWRAEIRLGLQSGRLVIGELAIRPHGERYTRGISAQLPTGGITMRLLRRLPIRARVQAVLAMLRRPPEMQTIKALLIDTPAEVLLNSIRPVAPKATGPRRGRKPISTETLLAVATAYAKAARGKDGQPVVDAARALGLHRARVSDLVHRARLRGLLTPAEWGRSGGQLTPQARRLLRRTKGKKKGGRK